MLKVGITGGIGAGKSMVCRVFATLGIPVFDADTAAKILMETDPLLVASITEIFGTEVYGSGKLNRDILAARVFQNPVMLQKLNAIVHPATIEYGRKWLAAQTAPYTIKEAAIFFETGSYKEMDVMIGVFAPKELRISRVLTRPGMTREKVIQRMENQMDDEQKRKLCHFTINNDGKVAIVPQVVHLHNLLLKKTQS